MNLTNWLTSPIAEALGWTLIHALWQGFAIVLVIAVLLHLARRSRASLRYQLGMSGLLVQVLASAGTFGWYYDPRSLAAIPALVVQPGLNRPIALMASTNESWLPTTQAFLTAHLAEVVWLWLIGVSFFAIRLIGGWLYVHRLQRTATLPVPALLSDVTARLVQQMNVSVGLQLSARVTGPLVVGILKPVVLWPVGLLAGLSVADVEAILAHELAHVRRHDYLLNVLQSAIDVLYFFHPALWWLSARVREEREHCCDDLAINVIGDGRVLAQALARVEEWQRDRAEAPTLAMAFASKRQLLLQRVRRMLGVPTRPLVSNASLAVLTLVTLLLVSVSLYAVQKPEPPKAERRPAPPTKTTRRHKIDSATEYGMIDNRRVSYVIWKGQKLPAARVARLQRQFDLIAAGQLSLAGVKQPDRDILQTISQTNESFDGGMNALASGLAHIAYTNMAADSKTTGSASLPTPAIEVMTPVSALADDTSRLRSVQQQLDVLTKEIKAIMAERQPMIEKLTKEMATLGVQNGAYQKQMAPIMGQLTQLAKQQQALAAKLTPINSEIQRLSQQNTTKAKALVRQKEAQAQQLEKEIDAVETKIDRLDDQMEQLVPHQARMEAISDSIEQLYEPMNALSEKMGELSEQLAEEAQEAIHQGETVQRGKYKVVDGDVIRSRPARASRPVRPTRPVRSIKPAITPVPARPNVPDPVEPAIAPTPEATPKPDPTPSIAPTPAVSPKPTLAPAPPVPARAPKARKAPKQRPD